MVPDGLDRRLTDVQRPALSMIEGLRHYTKELNDDTSTMRSKFVSVFRSAPQSGDVASGSKLLQSPTVSRHSLNGDGGSCRQSPSERARRHQHNYRASCDITQATELQATSTNSYQ